MKTTKMKRVALMSRVSSDEQAKGYSLDVQETDLRRFCQQNGIEVVYAFQEDHSAKSFKRPAFAQFLKLVSLRKLKIDHLLFTTWDRFSRNHLDSLLMIRRLEGYGVTAAAINQPLDLTNPDNKMMLAIYLAMPEIDNDRRSIKIRGGVRAALKTGRWSRRAPLGYRNVRDDNNKPDIIPANEARFITEAFELFAGGMSQAEIRSYLKKEGFKIPRQTLSNVLRNPMYKGKVIVPAEGDEPEMIIQGVHKGIVPEGLFNKVLEILNVKNAIRPRKNTNRKRPELPLRGMLGCNGCGKNLTGSASRSKTGERYYYYHCNVCAHTRLRAELVNSTFEAILSILKFNAKATKLYEAITRDKISERKEKKRFNIPLIEKRIGELRSRMQHVQDEYSLGKIPSEDYLDMKNRFESERKQLEESISSHQSEDKEAKAKLLKCLNAISNLAKLYLVADLDKKQRIAGSIFPEKLFFDGNKCRTQRINEVIRRILMNPSVFSKKKAGQLSDYLVLSGCVETMGVEPTTSCMPCKRSSQLSYAPNE